MGQLLGNLCLHLELLEFQSLEVVFVQSRVCSILLKDAVLYMLSARVSCGVLFALVFRAELFKDVV